MRIRVAMLGTALFGLVAAAPVAAVEDAGGAAPQFKEGDFIGMDQVDKLKPFLPEEFWDNRDFFFYEGMQLEIGPTNYDYSPPPEFKAATQKFKGQARIAQIDRGDDGR